MMLDHEQLVCPKCSNAVGLCFVYKAKTIRSTLREILPFFIKWHKQLRREKERPERSYEFLRHYHGIQDCLYALNFSRQTSKLDIPYRNSSSSSRRSLKIAFALNTDGFTTDSNQGNLDGDNSVLGGTRLGRIVSAGGRQLLSKLNSARKNFPMKVFLLLLGFYTANALATILGQTGDWDVLVAGFVVAAIEGIGMLMYRRKPLPTERLQSFVVMVNYWKAGVCLGLFVDAFKLGS